MRRCVLLVTALGLWAAAVPAGAHATWSLVAVDRASGEVGAAMASCVELPATYYGEDGVLELLVLVPGVGAGVTQADVNLEAATRIRAGLVAGASAVETIADVTAPDFDASAAQRQHAAVRLGEPAPAAFTGSGTIEWAGHRSGDDAAVQGNILVSEAVVADALAAFEAADGSLRDRLVSGLRAGSDVGGDSRCDSEQAALFAQVAVADRDGEVDATTVRVEPGDGRNPVELLAAAESAESADPPAASSGLAWWQLAVGVAAGLAVVAVLVGLARRRAGS